MDLAKLVEYLDDYLCVSAIEDYPDAFNGLQVEGRSEVARVMTAVDASVASVEAAGAWGADVLIVHHGLFWGRAAPVTGRLKRRMAPLIKNDISLYSAHLPLDAHPEAGNNALLARMLGLKPSGTFGEFHGTAIGVYAECDSPLAELSEKLGTGLGAEVRTFEFASGPVKRVGIVSGGGASALAEAARLGLDTLITGEAAHHDWFEASENRINLVLAGHYATETLGVRALGAHLKDRFGIEELFFDHPTGM